MVLRRAARRLREAGCVVKSIISDSGSPQRYAILHCLRAPVGGLFRHVIDLATAQAALGHRVGVICAASGDALTETRLLALAPHLQLGLHRLPMTRDVGRADYRAWRQVLVLSRELEIDVLHGHGAKGGAYARLAAAAINKKIQRLRCFYTPHGGSLHYVPTTIQGRFYGALERRLETWTDGILFESKFASDRYSAQIGAPKCATKVVVNGLMSAEFLPVISDENAADFVFVGELRMLKGVDVALEALAIVNKTHRATAIFAGDGPDAAKFKQQAQSLDLADLVAFPGMMRARDAFALGRVLLVPSRAESLPYIVLEAVAAGMPVLASNVGGIPEIIAHPFGPLLPPGDRIALAGAMLDAMAHKKALRENAIGLRDSIRDRFSVTTMAGAVTGFYGAAQGMRVAA